MVNLSHSGESPDGADKESNSSSSTSFSSDVFSPVICHGGEVTQGKLEPSAAQQLTPGTSPPAQTLDPSRSVSAVSIEKKNVDCSPELMLLEELHITHEKNRRSELQRRGLFETPSKGKENMNENLNEMEMAVRQQLESLAMQETFKSESSSSDSNRNFYSLSSRAAEFEQPSIMPPSYSSSFDVLDRHFAGLEINDHYYDDDRDGTYLSAALSRVDEDRNMASIQARMLNRGTSRQPMVPPARYNDMLAHNFGRLAPHVPDDDDDRRFASRLAGPGAVGEAVPPRSDEAGVLRAMERLQLLSSAPSKFSDYTTPSNKPYPSQPDIKLTSPPTYYRPMEVRPVKRVSQDQAFDLILKGFSANYRGNPDLDRNRSAEISPEENCSLFIVGLDPHITTHELLASIRDVGRVYATHINPPEPDRGHLTCAAKVVFFERAAAERFYTRFAQTGLHIPAHPAHPGRVTWNRVRTAQYDAGGRKTRVLLISGPTSIVNEPALRAYFSSKLQYQVDEVVCRGEDTARARALVEFRFGSFRCQAEAAWMALNREWKDLGVVVVFGRDPCDRFEEEQSDRCSHVLE
ncbi:hypothetical protein B0T19DRAFT_443146 [Cercophora scortea]|uniref:RRM domain-containing protein n=1 Tax=Cercophora scortea TaxID=314031 RepID=A0AAE0IEN7_9PEZI|nr:hypothetical protein B0T19DRAFT_443146 [Cercophora scortea]